MKNLQNYLVKALEANDLKALEIEFSKGVDPNTLLEDDYTLLMLCAGSHKIDVANLLFKYDANANILKKGGTSALKIACLKEDKAMVELLLKNNANPNQIDDKGFTPLMYCAINSSIDIVKILLKYDAKIELKSGCGGKTAKEFAEENNNIQMALYLEKAHELGKAPSISEIKPISEEKIIDPNKLVGQDNAKTKLSEIIALNKVNQERVKRGFPAMNVTLHAAFIGNPGTGKTTFARYYAQEIKKLGILEKGHLVEVTRRDLVAEFTGQTAPKTEKVVQSAFGGILFIDEAYSIKTSKEDNFGQECIDTLITLIENHRDKFILILAGYRDEMFNFLNLNPGLKSRIPNIVNFEDYNPDELKAIFQIMLDNFKLTIDDRSVDYALSEILKKKKERSFGNAREVRNLIDRAISQQSMRLSKKDLSTLSETDIATLIYSDLTEDPHDEATWEDFDKLEVDSRDKSAMNNLLNLVGLNTIKKELKLLSDFVRVSKARYQDKLPEIGLHMIFRGNPGTGKTTVARLLGEIFKELDFLSSGHLVEADRSRLVASYVGQTAIKTREVIEEALGGILFIDEAYTLYRGTHQSDSFGQEAIDTILKFMEDYRNRFIVILAGYPDEMDTFLTSNPGLSSRFSRTFTFDDYTSEELVSIAATMAEEKQYKFSSSCQETLKKLIDQEKSKNLTSFGNARYIRNILDRVYKNHASRMLEKGDINKLDKDVMNTLESDDFKNL